MALNTPHDLESDPAPPDDDVDPDLGEVDRLACGRALDHVFDRAEFPPDAHERHCPYCASARASLLALNQATEQVRAEDAADPSLQLNTARLTSILAIARAEVRRGRRIPLHQSPRAGARSEAKDSVEPSLMISEQAIAGVIRRAGDRIPGLQTRRCFIEPVPSPAGPVSPHQDEPSVIRARVTVSVAPTSKIPSLTATFRDRATAAVQDEIGIVVSAMDVEVQDLHDQP